MKVLSDIKIASFQSWDGSSCSSSLSITVAGGNYTLVLCNEFKETQAVEMTADEARDLANDLAKLLVGNCGVIHRDARESASTNRLVEGTDLYVCTRVSVAGEPYREGISLEIRDTEYTELLNIELDPFPCYKMVRFLQGAE